MGEAALRWGSQLEPVKAGRGHARSLKLAGLLALADDLQEIALAPAATAEAARRRSSIRAFLVRTTRLEKAGLRPGDHVLVDGARDLFADPLMLARIGGEYHLELASRLRTSCREGEFLGAFIGIIRKQGFARRLDSAVPLPAVPRTRECILQGRLEMLEETCAGTDNPRLKRALKTEAENIRKQLQSGASEN